MMDYFNDDFDERKYWAYGCNCLILGDRPMSDPGHGLPVDALDSVCKAYKDCVKCAKDRVLYQKAPRDRKYQNSCREVKLPPAEIQVGTILKESPTFLL